MIATEGNRLDEAEVSCHSDVRAFAAEEPCSQARALMTPGARMHTVDSVIRPAFLDAAEIVAALLRELVLAERWSTPSALPDFSAGARPVNSVREQQ